MAYLSVGELETDDRTCEWSTVTTRLRSFNGFPHVPDIPAERLARAGFYFTGKSDAVRCFSCGYIVDNWHQGDSPVQRHKEASPSCKFLECAHRMNPSDEGPSVYNEEAESMAFRLRTGEVYDEQPIYPKIPHMKSEDARYESFSNWPSDSPVQPTDLAQAGLFHVPEGNIQADRVQCFCCGGMIVGWEVGDDPWTEHARIYDNCYFILGHDVGNIPSEQPRQGCSNNTSPMESFMGRLESFKDRVHPIDPEKLARAGFYSTGQSDRVICFKCGGSLKSWQPNEDPWEEHARHYPGCSFVLGEKGQEFINSVQLRKPGASSSNGFNRNHGTSSVMQSEIAQKAVAIGFEPGKVERTILDKIRQTHLGYLTVDKLVNDITSGKFESDADVSPNSQNEDPLKKLEKLQFEKLCKVCMDRDICIVFLPCGHLVTCKTCSDSLNKCPICCAFITQKIKTYCS